MARSPRPGSVSRAAFARRFTDLVGQPPMAFLTGWRLALAADLLRETEPRSRPVAERVGYGSPFALSTAFKRVGPSPQHYRTRARGSAAAAESADGSYPDVERLRCRLSSRPTKVSAKTSKSPERRERLAR